jgi:peptidoglycan/xylan/chitin deacetylase (PgdA/CDA1 family)
MNFRAIVLCASVLALAACGKHAPKAAPTPSPTPTPVPTATPPPTPPPTPTPTPFALDKSSQVIVLCYHRFEEKPKPKDDLAIKPQEFEAQMQELKNKGITVIPMDDFLAWRAGTKNIPAKAAVISIDDGYLSGYTTAWPILKKFGYPFTMYIYTDYVKGGPKSGGQSMTWDQLAEMRDTGVDIGCHTVSHSALNARKGKTDEQYRAWLQHELGDSKQMLEQNLGIKVKTLAYPYGMHNEVVRQIAMQCGYEAAFTVYGQHLHHDGDPSMIGRYAVGSTKPQIFQQAVSFGNTAAVEPGMAGAPTSMPAAAAMISEPMQGETIANPKPTLKINIAAFGPVDPKTVEMRISGFGLVPATYDPTSQLVTYPMHQSLREHDITVIVSAKTTAGRKASTSWSFHFDPAAGASPTATPVATPVPSGTGLPAAAQ